MPLLTISFNGFGSACSKSRIFAAYLIFPAPHKDFSDLYEKMSGRGESAVLSP